MAKKITVPASAVNAAEEILGPDPLPQVGDQVSYVWPSDGSNIKIAGTIRRATVTAVIEGFDGRLVNLDVDTGEGRAPQIRAPWRDAADHAGNTWHQPE